jgi:hypothetical protein
VNISFTDLVSKGQYKTKHQQKTIIGWTYNIYHSRVCTSTYVVKSYNRKCAKILLEMVEVLLGLKQNQRNKTSLQQRFEKCPTDGVAVE